MQGKKDAVLRRCCKPPPSLHRCKFPTSAMRMDSTLNEYVEEEGAAEQLAHCCTKVASGRDKGGRARPKSKHWKEAAGGMIATVPRKARNGMPMGSSSSQRSTLRAGVARMWSVKEV